MSLNLPSLAESDKPPAKHVGSAGGLYVYYKSLTCLLKSRDRAVAEKPREQKAKRRVQPKDPRSAPARTEAMGIMPCEPMLIRLFTLLSLSLSTTRMTFVVTGMLIEEIRKPMSTHPMPKAIRNTLIPVPRSTKIR